MCYALYLSTDKKQIIEKGIPKGMALYLRELTKDSEKEGLKLKFTKQNIYYIGSYEGCSCGFFVEGDDGKKDEALRVLNLLIRQIIEDDEVEIYSCWEGTWGLQPEQVREMVLGKEQIFQPKEKALMKLKKRNNN
jgi:hypothetical protein